MDSTVHRILQARILEWVAFPFSRESSQPRSPTLQAASLPTEPQQKPIEIANRYTYMLLVVKNPPASAGNKEMWVPSLGWESPLEEGMATHLCILA